MYQTQMTYILQFDGLWMFEDIHMIYDLLCVAHFKWKAFKQQSFDIFFTTLQPYFFQAITTLPNLTK